MKMIAAMVMMAMTVAMPAMAGNRHHNNHKHHDKNVVVVVHHKGGPHFDKRAAHFDRHHAPRPEMRICAVYLSRFDSPVLQWQEQSVSMAWQMLSTIPAHVR